MINVNLISFNDHISTDVHFSRKLAKIQKIQLLITVQTLCFSKPLTICFIIVLWLPIISLYKDVYLAFMKYNNTVYRGKHIK